MIPCELYWNSEANLGNFVRGKTTLFRTSDAISKRKMSLLVPSKKERKMKKR